MAGEGLPQSMELGKSQKNMKEQAREASGRGCQTARAARTGPWREGPGMLGKRGGQNDWSRGGAGKTRSEPWQELGGRSRGLAVDGCL